MKDGSRALSAWTSLGTLPNIARMAVAAAWGIPQGVSTDVAIRDPARVATAGTVIPRALRQRRILDRVSELAASALGVSAGMVTVISDDRIHVVGSTSGGPASLPLDHVPCPFVVAHGAPVAIPDLGEDPVGAALTGRADGITAYAAAPLVVRGQVIGTVAVTDGRRHAFSADDLSLLEDLAGAVEHQLGRLDGAGLA